MYIPAEPNPDEQLSNIIANTIFRWREVLNQANMLLYMKPHIERRISESHYYNKSTQKFCGLFVNAIDEDAEHLICIGMADWDENESKKRPTSKFYYRKDFSNELL